MLGTKKTILNLMKSAHNQHHPNRQPLNDNSEDGWWCWCREVCTTSESPSLKLVS